MPDGALLTIFVHGFASPDDWDHLAAMVAQMRERWPASTRGTGPGQAVAFPRGGSRRPGMKGVWNARWGSAHWTPTGTLVIHLEDDPE